MFIKNLFKFTNKMAKVAAIKADEERRKTSKIYGVSAIVMAIFAILFSMLFSWSMKTMQNGDVAILLVWVLVLLGALGTAVLLINSIINWLMQLIINRKPFTWISLVMVLVCIAVCAYFVIISLTV